MKKTKFIYDEQSASFVPVTVDKIKVLRNILLFVGFSFFIGVLLSFYLPKWLYGDHEKMLLSELEAVKKQYQKVNLSLKTSLKQLEEIEQKDEYLYRNYFDMNEIPDDVRKGGFGGVDRYEELAQLPYGKLIAETSKLADILENKVKIQKNSLKEIEVTAKKSVEDLARIPAVQPVNNKGLDILTSGFGMRKHPVLGIHRMHTGLDFKVKVGTPVYATADGVVEFAGVQNGYGNVIIINHGNGFKTLYGHLSRHKVRKGQKVKRGDEIALSGNTGISSGPHVHYEVIKDNKKIDPAPYFYHDLSAEDYAKFLENAKKNPLSFD